MSPLRRNFMRDENTGHNTMGCYLSLYSLLVFAVSVHITTHAFSPLYLLFNLIPFGFILLGFMVIYGQEPQVRRAAFWINAAMAFCGLQLIYLVFALPPKVNWLMSIHLFFQSWAFYLLNLVILMIFYYKLMQKVEVPSFWHHSPWRGGLLVFVLGGLAVIYALSLAWTPYTYGVKIPAENLTKYLQGQEAKFARTSILYPSAKAEQDTINVHGVAFDSQRVRAVSLSWSPISKEAYDSIKSAAEQGDAEAQLALGVAYLASMGISSNLEQAVHWFSKSAEQGNAKAQEALAIAYINGVGGPQKVGHGYQLLLQSAKSGNTEAQRIVTKIQASGF